MDYEEQKRSSDRACADALFAALQLHHGSVEAKTPKAPETVQPIEEPNSTMARLRLLEEEVGELQATIARQRKIIIQLSETDEISHPKFSDIMDAVCAFYKVTKGGICSQRRTKELVIPRQVICYLARETTKMSLPQIGRRLGNRDHTTILYAVNLIAGRIENDEILRDDVDVLKAKLEAVVTRRQTLVTGEAA